MCTVQAYYRVKNKKRHVSKVLKMVDYPTFREQWFYAVETAIAATGDDEILDKIVLIRR